MGKLFRDSHCSLKSTRNFNGIPENIGINIRNSHPNRLYIAGDINAVRSAIANGADVNGGNNIGTTALHYSSLNGN